MLSSFSQQPEPSAPPPADAGDALDALIAQTRRLREGVESARRTERPRGARQRVRRAVWDLAVDRLDDFGERLDQLRSVAAPDGRARLGAHIGSAEWNLLTDGVAWSEEVFSIFGRDAGDGPLTLDELPSRVPAADQPALTAAVTACLVDGRPMECEFRVIRPDGSLRTVQLSGEPVLDERGGTVAMWAMVRDVSELRRSEAGSGVGLGEGGGEGEDEDEELGRLRRVARAQRGIAIELADAALAPWLGSPEPQGAAGARGSLELAARYLPARAGTPVSGKWCDVLRLPGGGRLLSVGDLSGQGAAAAVSAATTLGAIRGIALTGAAPGALLAHLNLLLDNGMHPVLASAACCRYEPGGDGGVLSWAQAGHPAPLLCRRGEARLLPRPPGPLLGAMTDPEYAQRAEPLEPGDVLVLYTQGLFPAIPPATDGGPAAPAGGEARLTALGERLGAAGSAEECLELIVSACGETGREDDACVLVARIAP